MISKSVVVSRLLTSKWDRISAMSAIKIIVTKPVKMELSEPESLRA
jgi:hypothetical protein